MFLRRTSSYLKTKATHLRLISTTSPLPPTTIPPPLPPKLKKYSITTHGKLNQSTSYATTSPLSPPPTLSTHIIRTSLPKINGGLNTGPSPVHVLLGSLTGCCTSTLHYVSRKWPLTLNNGEKKVGFSVIDTTYNLSTERNERGTLSLPITTDPNVSPRLHKVFGTCVVKLSPDFKGVVTRSVIEEVGRMVELRCPVACTLVYGGTVVDVKWLVEFVGVDDEIDGEGSKLSPSLSRPPSTNFTPPKAVHIHGAGLAGLSVAYSLLCTEPSLNVKLYDPNHSNGSEVSGKDNDEDTDEDMVRGDAACSSSLPYALCHPFNPRGNLINLGLEGLNKTTEIIEKIETMNTNSEIRVRDLSVYRACVSEFNVIQAKKSAVRFRGSGLTGEYIPLLDSSHSNDDAGADADADDANNGDDLDEGEVGEKMKGKINLRGYVVNMPNYLTGLLQLCDRMSIDAGGCGVEIINESGYDFAQPLNNVKQLGEDEVRVFAAGAAMFQVGCEERFITLPVKCVPGQGVEFILPPSHIRGSEDDGGESKSEALICGKYLIDIEIDGGGRRVVLGSTHEFLDDDDDSEGDEQDNSTGDVKRDVKQVTMNPQSSQITWLTPLQVIAELSLYLSPLKPKLFTAATTNVNFFRGVRVQSERSNLGRDPIIGRLSHPMSATNSKFSNDGNSGSGCNEYIFTGLGARGLITSGVWGEILAKEIMEGAGEGEVPRWWRKPVIFKTERKRGREGSSD